MKHGQLNPGIGAGMLKAKAMQVTFPITAEITWDGNEANVRQAVVCG